MYGKVDKLTMQLLRPPKGHLVEQAFVRNLSGSEHLKHDEEYQFACEMHEVKVLWNLDPTGNTRSQPQSNQQRAKDLEGDKLSEGINLHESSITEEQAEKVKLFLIK